MSNVQCTRRIHCYEVLKFLRKGLKFCLFGCFCVCLLAASLTEPQSLEIDGKLKDTEVLYLAAKKNVLLPQKF